MKDRELPETARRGELIVNANPQPEVRKNAETARDWEYSNEAKYLYRIAVLLRERLIDPIARINRSQMPDPIISFTNLRNLNTLAAYRLTRNPQGLLYEITFNSEHYIDVEDKMTWRFGQWALLETLAHELVHEWQQTMGEDPVKPGKAYHNKEFVEKCETIGLHPKIGEGYHLSLANGPFAVLMKELGVSPPDLSDQPPDINWDWFKWLLDYRGKKPKGRSSLTKWECPECGLKVRMGIKGDPRLRHDPCEQIVGGVVYLIRSIEIETRRVNYQAPDEFNDELPEEQYNQFNDPEDLTAYLEPYQN